MQPPPVKKQRTEEREEGRNRIKSVTGKQENKLVRNDTEVKDESFEIRAEGYLVEKNQNIDNDERYVGEGKSQGRYVILEGNHYLNRLVGV
jgi:hypothetical protein